VLGADPALSLSHNQFSQTPDSKAWFQDWVQQDFRPVAGSPLVGTADAKWAPDVDIDGNPRTDPFDVGAYQSPH
jgi:hypothetical protein